jgi:signal transduction histidine kinase/ActR/RegA family two-component response regulator
MKSKRLRIKINASILLACAVVAILFAALFFPFETRRRENRLAEIRFFLEAVYQQRREDLANEIFAEQKAALADSLRQIREIQGIEGLTVFDLAGRPMLSTAAGPPEPLPPEVRTALDTDIRFYRRPGGDRPLAVYETGIRVIGEQVGYLRMVYDLTRLERESTLTLTLFLALLGITIAVLAVMLNLLLTRSVLRPVSVLRDAMRRVQSGRLGETVPLENGDEIGEMAAAFNEMSTRLNQQRQELLASIRDRDKYFDRLEKSNLELEALNAGLEGLVEERTQRLRQRNERLRQEIRERRRADQERKRLEERLNRSRKMEALGLLAGGVAHDLNNVLSGIVSYPDLILADLPPDSPLNKSVNAIRESGQKAAAIVQDLLTLARRGVTQTQVLHLNEDVIRDCMTSPEMAALRADYPDIWFETRLADGLLHIRGSAVHLKKTVMNLVVNAAEAQPEGGTIVIASENRYVDRPIQGYDQVKEGDYVLLRVEDQGVGIAPEDLERIFEPFYTKKVMGRSGTGLGMAVVWGAVQDHRGYINVRSVPGEGSAFELYFPVTREARAEAPEPPRLEGLMGNGQSVLVVDDVPEQRDIAARMLTRLGYTVETVESGEGAVQRLAEGAVDLLVLDMIMEPGIDGLETYRRISDIRPGQPCVIASGFAESERVREAQQLGAGPYLRKPYTLERLGHALRDALTRAERRRRSAVG